MRALVLVAALAACRNDGGDDYMIVPGGDDTIIGPMVDARMPDSSDGGVGTIPGRVCLLVDARDPSVCAATGAGGLAVMVGTESALTGDDGAFTITTPAGTGLVWRVSGASIVTSVMGFGATPSIPAILATTYEDLLTTNGVILLADQGSVMAQVVKQNAPLAGATVTSNPTAAYATFYDGSSVAQWDQDATGTFGVAWFAGLTAGAVTLTATPPLGAVTSTAVGVEQQAITFATLVVP